jgi:hypothetical protein
MAASKDVGLSKAARFFFQQRAMENRELFAKVLQDDGLYSLFIKFNLVYLNLSD